LLRVARIKALADAVDAAYSSDEAKRRFEILARQVFIRFKALLMEPTAFAYAERHDKYPQTSLTEPAPLPKLMQKWPDRQVGVSFRRAGSVAKSRRRDSLVALHPSAVRHP
jgi:hypothetical protein